VRSHRDYEQRIAPAERSRCAISRPSVVLPFPLALAITATFDTDIVAP
jgi:hypothetical protein